MAEFLFRGKNNGTEPAHWRRGDLVVIRPDGHTWGVLETRAAWVAAGFDPAQWPGDFYLLKVPGMSVTKAETYIEAWIDNNNDPGGLGARAVWRVLISEIPTAIRNILLNTGQLTVGVDVTRAQIEARLRRKDTEATADLT